MPNKSYEIVVQQGSPEWLEHRRGKFTMSNLSKLMESTPAARNKLIDCLAMEVKSANFDNAAMAWGRNHEAQARSIYNLSALHQARECGFFCHLEWPIGGSPDGVIEISEGTIIGGIEIKCPFNQDQHLKHLDGIIKPEYYWQCQGNMWLTDAMFWDFISFDPRLRDDNMMSINRLPREYKIMQRIEETVADFVEKLSSGKRYDDDPTSTVILSGLVKEIIN